jgi:hypothetical protein
MPTILLIEIAIGGELMTTSTVDIDTIFYDFTQLLIEFYIGAFGYYELTGHDILEYPDKQYLIMQKVHSLGIFQNESDKRSQMERDLVKTINNLDKLYQERNATNCQNPGGQKCWEECCERATICCSDILEIAPSGRVHLRHFELKELLNRGLYFEL